MKPTPRPELKDAIFRSGKKQKGIAKRARIQESRLSKFIHGTADPTPEEQDRLAKALETDASALFGAMTEARA